MKRITPRLGALRAIPLVLFFVAAAFGCATGRNQVADPVFGLTATAAPNGILLTFDNIPDDTVRLFIHVQSWGDGAEPSDPHYITASIADIVDESFHVAIPSFQLERVRQTGAVVFPIVQAGQRYHISAMATTARDIQLMMDDAYHHPVSANAEVVAGNGVYFNRDDVILELNDSNSAVTLVSRPTFDSELDFLDQKYSFGVTIIVDGQRSIGVGDHHRQEGLSADGLTWTFEPEMTEGLRKDSGGWLESGVSYSAWVGAYVNIVYDDIAWSVGIARTPRFAFSLD